MQGGTQTYIYLGVPLFVAAATENVPRCKIEPAPSASISPHGHASAPLWHCRDGVVKQAAVELHSCCSVTPLAHAAEQAVSGISLFIPGSWMLRLLSGRVALHVVEQETFLGHAAHEHQLLMPGLNCLTIQPT